MESFRVAACQVRAHDIESAEENLANILRALDEAGAAGAQLVALPECAHPAYYLKDADPYDRPGVRLYDEVVALFAERARRYGYWLAAGMAVPHGPGRVTNSGVVISPDGEVRGRYDKSFLWHFDNNWFEGGTAFPTWDAGFCRFGILVCADGRQPEVARSLAVNGAEVILDLTAWVSWARTLQDLNTTQCEYLMPARAFENGVWVVAADKWGPEDGTIVYAGRSCVIDPEGIVRVCAPSQGDAVVVFDIEPLPVERPARRPALYGRLVQPTDELPVTALLREPLVPAEWNRRVAVVPGDGAFDGAGLAARYESVRRQDTDLAVFAGMSAANVWETELATIEECVRANGGGVVFGVEAGGVREAVLVLPGQTIRHRASHGPGQLGEELPPVVETPVGLVGLMCGDEGFVPEVGRILALEGAEFLAWPLFGAPEMAERIARCRADENRVYVAAAWAGGGMVIAPGGGPLTAVPTGSGIAMAAQVNRAITRWKDMAPGTHATASRRPAAYQALTRP